MSWYHCWLRHDWGKWERVKAKRAHVNEWTGTVTAKTVHSMQVRSCKLCGYEQLESL